MNSYLQKRQVRKLPERQRQPKASSTGFVCRQKRQTRHVSKETGWSDPEKDKASKECMCAPHQTSCQQRRQTRQQSYEKCLARIQAIAKEIKQETSVRSGAHHGMRPNFHLAWCKMAHTSSLPSLPFCRMRLFFGASVGRLPLPHLGVNPITIEMTTFIKQPQTLTALQFIFRSLHLRPLHCDFLGSSLS